MNVPRTMDNGCELRPTLNALHIPASNAFIPFQHFSLSDGARNPADDNNNKTLPVVSVVAAVTGMCPAVSMVSMQQSSQLAQSVVTATIIPTVMTPIAVQATNCLAPTTTMTVSNAVNISSRLSMAPNHQQNLVSSGISISHQTGSIINNNIISHNIATTTGPQAPQGLVEIISTAPSSAAHSNKATNSNSVTSTSIAPPAKSSLPTNTSSSAKSSNGASPKVSSTTSNQGTSSEQTDDLVKPVFKDGELVLEVECGQNKAILYLSKLCQGSKGPCINFQSSWLTPNEFQFVSGRETAKDWKRSIRHHGKSLKLLLAKGILNVHPTMCDCDGCRQGATLTRKGEKRRIPNGERKIKKPSSSSSAGNCTEGSGIRSGTASLAAAHLGAPGIAQVKPELTQIRPEVKKPLVDLSKRSDVAVQGHLPETNTCSQQQNHCIKTPAVQVQDLLVISKDFPKDKIGSLSTGLNCQTAQTQMTITPHLKASPAVAVQPVHPSSTLGTPATIISAFPSLMSSVVASHQIPIHVSSGIEATIQESPKTSAVATGLSCPGASNPNIESTVAGPTLPVPELYIKHLAHNPALLQILSPNLPDAKEAQTPTPTTCDITEFPYQSSDIGAEDSGVSDDEDINVGNDTEDESFNTEGKYDTPDDESDDECTDDPNKISEDDNDDDCVYDTKRTEGSSPGSLVDKVDQNPSIEQKAYSDSFYSGLAICEQKHLVEDKANIDSHRIQSNVEGQEHVCELKTHVDTQECGEFPKTSTPISHSGTYDSSRHSETTSLLATTALSVSAISSTCSKPMPLSISSHVKSEHVWIPPTVSSQTSESNSTHRPQPSCARNSKPLSSIQTKQGKHHRDDGRNAASKKEYSKDTLSQKTDTSLECSDTVLLARNTENHSPDVVLSHRDVHVEVPHLAQNITDHRNNVVCKDMTGLAQVQTNPCRSESTSDKRNNDRDREERHRLRLKEDKTRKDREERSKKDRDRDERRDRERKEEKEAERVREEERERKIHSESRSAKDVPAASPTSDQSRRPTGGVAEAAAFSDYMRFLAAGHGHSFMSPTAGYMCSFFPIQPQETALAPHLVHPFSSFSPQLGHFHKDPLMYQSSATALAHFGSPAFGHTQPVLHRPQYTAQQSVLDYQRSLAAAASSYPWAATYPYFFQASPASATAAVAAAGTKRSATELEATMELSAKRMRLDGRFSEYTSPWDYFAAAADYQHLRVPSSMAPALPCGMESTSMDKTTEYLRKRYLEYGPQAAMYLSALPEYARPAYQCACADHREEDIRLWSVDDVCRFLSSVDGCGMYVEYFREQRVNGRILTMLTSEHLVNTMGMKLGSAVLLAEAVAKKIQDASKMTRCEACRSIALSVPMHPMVLPL